MCRRTNSAKAASDWCAEYSRTRSMSLASVIYPIFPTGSGLGHLFLRVACCYHEHFDGSAGGNQLQAEIFPQRPQGFDLECVALEIRIPGKIDIVLVRQPGFINHWHIELKT